MTISIDRVGAGIIPRMIRKFRKVIPHSLVNLGKHFPEAVAANIRFGFPGKKIRVIGVTGTDGKTTTVNMIYQIFKAAGKKVSMISTINAVVGGKSYETGFHVTSPHPQDVQKYLKTTLDSGDEFMVLEVTSHALEQFRVWGVQFEVGVITNITHEHLDYHGSFKKYRDAKAKLIKGVKVAVLNHDDPSFNNLVSKTSGKVLSFGMTKQATINPDNFPLNLSIVGGFNILNAEAAAATALSLGIDKKIIRKVLENFRGLSGRMEEIKNNKGIKVVVDFAHTPNALAQALQTLRPITSGRLIAVFGAAAERDRFKRPLMGEVAAKLADIIILTDEDPRFEDRKMIIEEIAGGAYKEGAKDKINLFKEPDRKKAIKLAIMMAKNGDTVGIFGKGHEKSMNYQGIERSWSDQKVARQIIV